MGAKGGKGQRTGQVRRRGVPFSRPLPGPCRRVAAQSGQPVTKYKLYPLKDSQIMQSFLTFFYVTILTYWPPPLPRVPTPLPACLLQALQSSPSLKPHLPSPLLPHHSDLPAPDHAQIACFALLSSCTGRPTSTGALVAVVVVETHFFSGCFCGQGSSLHGDSRALRGERERERETENSLPALKPGRDFKVIPKAERGPLLGLRDPPAPAPRTGGRMTIRPGQPSRKSPPAGATKPSSKGMDVVMMSDFEQRHHTNKSRSHSPFGHIGSPTTPLNFEQLFLQGQIPLNSELSQHDQNMLQAQLLNSMRTTGMAPKPKQQQQSQQPSLAMLDQLRQAYNRGEQEQAEWNTRALTHEPPSEPSTIALLQQKFAQLERHKAEMQKSASQPQQVQIYPSQWPMSAATAMPPPPPPPPVSSAPYPEPRHFVPTSTGFYSFQHPPETPDHFTWRPTPPDSRPPPQPWSNANATPPSEIAPLVYMTQQGQQQQQFQHPAPKPVDYHQHFAVPPPPPPQAPFTSFQLNSPPPPDITLLNNVSSRCDKTGGHSVEIKAAPDHYRSDDSEMSLDNFSNRISSASSQIPFSNNFHMLPQSSKSAFSTFTRPSSNLNPEAVVTKSLLFNDTYRRSQEVVPDLMHDDVDTELHL